MTKQILIELNAVDKASPKIKKTEKAVASLGSKVKTSSMSQAKSFEDVSQTLDALGNRFRYLSLVAGMAAGAMTMMASRFVKDAMQLEQSQMKVGAFARISGQSFEQANEVAQRFARQGIMSVTEAYNTLSNLLATGLNIDKAEALMQGAQDMAVLAKESLTDTTGQAMEKFSLGIRIMQERMIDAVGVNFVAIQVWKKYGDELDKTTDQMSSDEKQQAMINYVMKEFVKVEGASAIAATTFSGTINRLSANVEQMSASLGSSLMPVLGPLAELLIKAANSIREFAKEFPALTMVVLSGSVAVTVLVASIAMLGALVPMVTGKMTIGIAALKSMAAVSAITALKFIALAIVVGTLIYLIAKATGQWDKFTNAMKNMQNRIADTIKPAKELNETIADPKVAKQLAKIQQSIERTTRNFKENMRDWVDKHDKTVRDLKSQINDLEREYTKALNKINDNFKDNQEDEALAHRRKVEDIQREIDEEVSKGLWADQTKIRNLERELARENEDYAIAQSRNEERREEDLQDTETKYSERLAKLEKELADEEALEKRHAGRIAKYRTWPLIDQIEKQERQHRERIEQLQEQLNDIKGNAEAQIGANGDMNTSIGELIGAEEERRKHSVWSAAGIAEAWLNSKDNIVFAGGEIEKHLVKSWDNIKWAIQWVVDLLKDTDWNQIGQNIRTWLVGAFEWFLTVLSEVDKQFREFIGWVESKVTNVKPPSVPAVVETAGGIMGGITDVGAGIGDLIAGILGTTWPPFATGGVVPGSPTQAVPIIAHGGETVIPAGQSPITVNINGPIVRNNSDITRIANQVEEVLSRRTFLKQLK